MWFERETRLDYDPIWVTDNFSLAFHETQRLKEVRLEHDADLNGSFEQVVRKYVFSYNASGEGIIFPGYSWPDTDQNPATVGKTLALKQVQEFGLNGASLPATTFTYGDGMHLTRAENGYGGGGGVVYARGWDEGGAGGGGKIAEGFGEGGGTRRGGQQ